MADTGPQNRWEPAKPVGDTFGARTAEQQNKSPLFRRLWTNLSPFCNTSFLPVAPSEIAPRSKHAQAMERGIPVPVYFGLGNFTPRSTHFPYTPLFVPSLPGN